MLLRSGEGRLLLMGRKTESDSAKSCDDSYGAEGDCDDDGGDDDDDGDDEDGDGDDGNNGDEDTIP